MTYIVHGMNCGKCVQKIKDGLAQKNIAVDVTLQPPRLIVQEAFPVPMDEINQILAQIGDYHVTQKETAQKESGAQHGANIASNAAPKDLRAWFKTYYPLLLIVTMISLVSLRGAATLHDWMMHFMAGFFLMFGFFKLLDIRGFRDAYAGYDLLAKRWYGYGFVYPFLELALGFAFLFRFEVTASLWASVILMGFGGLGVVNALRKKQTIRCACLGTVLNLPMSTVTLIENFGMVLMSILMLAGIL